MANRDYPGNTKDNPPAHVPDHYPSDGQSGHLDGAQMTGAGQNKAWDSKPVGLPWNPDSIDHYYGAVPEHGALQGVPWSDKAVDGSDMTISGQNRAWGSRGGYHEDARTIPTISGTDPAATKLSRFKPLTGE